MESSDLECVYKTGPAED